MPGDEPAHLDHGRVEGRTSTFREQGRTWFEAAPGEPVTVEVQRTVTVTTDRVGEDGRAQIRVDDGEGASSWVLEPDGRWWLAQDTREDAPLALGHGVPAIGSFDPPEGSVRVGQDWTVPIRVDATVDRGPARGTHLVLEGEARWRFEGWGELAGTRCPVLVEALSVRGHTDVGDVRLGVAGERASEVCWDPDRGEVYWQQAATNLVITLGSEAFRVRTEAYVGRINPR